MDLIDFSEPEPELEVIDFKDFSRPELDLIDFKDFFKLEPVLIDLSDPEPKLDCWLKPKEIEFEMPLGICIEEYDINTEIESESNDKVGISSFETIIGSFSRIFTGNFFKSMAKLYDPGGFWEPIKLQMKLVVFPLKGLDWGEEISSTEQEKWTDIIAMFVELNDIQMPICCIPSDD